MKPFLLSWGKFFSGVCVAVFIAGQTFSINFALKENTNQITVSEEPQSSSDVTTIDVTTIPSSSPSSVAPFSSSSVSSPSSLASLLSSASEPTTVVPVSSVPTVLNNPEYKETPEDKKEDPGGNNKPVDSDLKEDVKPQDTVQAKDVITEVTPYVVKVTGTNTNVWLRKSMSTADKSNTYCTVKSGLRLLCNADGTAKDGSRWRRVIYKNKTLFISALWTEATGEDPSTLNSSSQSSSSAAPPSSSDLSSGSSTSSDTVVLDPTKLQGWQTKEGKTYYYVNGEPLTGWQVIGGFRYLFDETGVKISKTGVDVSRYQTDIDWKSVKEAGIEFAIIRVGFRGYGSGKVVLDPYFEKNIKGAAEVGIPCGVYIYSSAINTEEAIEEANFVLGALKDYNVKLDYPVMYDIEQLTYRCEGMTKDQFTDNTIAFLDTIIKAGYKAMYCTYRNFLNTHLDAKRLEKYDLWLAVYSNAPDDSPVADYNYKIWQYTSSGKVNGIPGNVDVNIQISPIE